MKEEKKNVNKEEEKKDIINPADEADIEVLKSYGKGPYTEKIKSLEDEVKKLSTDVNKLAGIRESSTGLAHPSNWVIEVN